MNPINNTNQHVLKTEKPVNQPDSKSKAVNMNYLEALSGNNREFINAMLNAFKDESAVFISGMEENVSLLDYLSIQLASHKLKPAGVYIGSNYFSMLMDLLEHAAQRANEQQVISLFGQVKAALRSILSEIDEYLTGHPLPLQRI